MVTRTSKEINLTPNLPRASIAGSSIGMTSPNVGEKQVLDQAATASDRVLASILGDVKPLLQQGLQSAQEEAYLKGASSAAEGQAQEALDSNPMTSDWANAGYRDTAGKLNFASTEAKFSSDLKQLREESPEKLQEYLATRRTNLMPSMEGMSREQRTAMFGKMMLADQHAIAAHTSEHTKFIIEQELKPIQTEHATALAAMDAGLKSGSAPQYAAALNKFQANLYENMMLNPRLPDLTLREGLTVEAIKGALATGNVKAYTNARDMQVPDGKGGATSILGMLSLKNQEALSKAHYTAMEQTDSARNLAHTRTLSEFYAANQSGGYTGSRDDMFALQEKHVQLYPKDQAGAAKIYDTWLDGQTKYKNQATIVAAASRGDITGLLGLGSSDEAGVKLWHESMVKAGAPVDVQVANLAGAAGKSPAAAKLLGGTISTAIQGAIGNDGKMSESGRATVAKINTLIDGLEADNKQGITASVYAGMSEEGAIRFQNLRALTTEFGAAEAGPRLIKLEADLAKESKASKAARVQADAKEFQNYNDSLEPAGFWSRAVAHLPLVGRSLNQAKLAPATSWWTSMTDDSAVTAKIVWDSKTAISTEAQRIRQIDPSRPADKVMALAEAAVLKRAIITPDAPLILPAGRTPQEFFGTNATVDMIGQAITNSVPKMNPDNRMIYRMDGNRLTYTEYNKNSDVTVHSGEIKVNDIKVKCNDLINGVRAKTGEAYGAGVTIPVGTGTININGDNTASMSNDNMLAIRKNLLKFEGYTDKPMRDVGGRVRADGTPVMTSGFGVSNTNNHYQAEGTPEQHKANFIQATNEAGRDASKVVSVYGLRGDTWTQLTTELVYQSGISNVVGVGKRKQDPAYAALFANKNPAMTIDLIKATPAFKMSGKGDKLTGRQKHYLALAQQIQTQQIEATTSQF